MKIMGLCKMKGASVFCLFVLFILPTDLVQAATFITVEGEVVIEAENFTRLAGQVGGQWSVRSDLPGYRGSGYIQSAADDPSTLSFSQNIISAQYDIDFRQTGTYYIHLRSHAEDDTQNGFFATVDGTPISYGNEEASYIFVKPFVAPNSRWHWYSDGGGAEERNLVLSFDITDPGVKTLAIYRRDKRSKIDRLWITQNVSEAQDTGFIGLSDPVDFIVTDDPEICDDSLDNNNNGLTDCDDSDCAEYAGCIPEGVCDDGQDNDLDDLTDCDDPDCGEYAGCIPEDVCDDGQDNDLDDLTDCDDPDCAEYTDCIPEDVCDDGQDNDLDDLTDCDDPDCGEYAGCNPESECNNGVDDDLDGLKDCDDSDCSELDSDNDNVADCNDAYPQDPQESQDTDKDEVGDNEDEDDDGDSVVDVEEAGENGDIPDYDGNADGDPDAKQNSVASLHSLSGDHYLTFAVSEQGVFSVLSAGDASSLPPLPKKTTLDYDLFNVGMHLSKEGTNVEVTLYLPKKNTVEGVLLFGPTPDDPKEHWFRFDFDGEVGAQVSDNVVTLTFVDGRIGDRDLKPNGTVSALIAPANMIIQAEGSSGKSDDGGSNGCFVQSLR